MNQYRQESYAAGDPLELEQEFLAGRFHDKIMSVPNMPKNDRLSRIWRKMDRRTKMFTAHADYDEHGIESDPEVMKLDSDEEDDGDEIGGDPPYSNMPTELAQLFASLTA